jgi:hypothetical protein
MSLDFYEIFEEIRCEFADCNKIATYNDTNGKLFCKECAHFYWNEQIKIENLNKIGLQRERYFEEKNEE